MASGTFASPPTPPPVQAAAQAVAGAGGGYDQYVETQLRRTRTQVKLVDIVSNSLVLICGALAYMLAVALVDHWLVTLSFTARMLALAVLVVGCGWWLYVRIMPLIVRRINPVYAALTIERAEPSLKNSLINFLLLRGERGKVHEVVYQALGQRAASDLSHMPAETVVDYNPLIRIGYVLAALVIFGASYKILSPKDPVQSVARVMAPWADIARASRVAIDDVRPGEAKIFQGDHVEVSAILRGIRASDNVRVVFSTIDGQVLDQEVKLSPDTAGLRHLAKIPDGDMGAQSSLQYKLIAGDAETKWYNVEVAPAPHVLVSKVEYDPPAYTKLAAEESAHGDISGLEGTNVTIYARANREIDSAYLEFDPVLDPKAATPDSGSDARSLRITQISGQNLQVSFQLRMNDKRDAAWHKHYTIRYTSKEGHRNTRPIIHTLSVKPDLAPLTEILSPSLAEREKTVPQNRMVEIEAKGIDLDFALTKLRLVAVSGGRDVMDVALLDSPDGQSGQVIKKLEFTPSHYALAVGDVVEYWAVAEDNRQSPRNGKPEPNITSSTPTYRLIIGPPEVERAKPEGEEKSEDGERGEGDEGSESSSGGAPQDEQNGNSQSKENSREPTARDDSQESGESGDAGGSGGTQGGSSSASEKQESDSSEGEGEGSESSREQEGASGNRGTSSNQPSDNPSGESGEAGTESSSEGSESQSGGNSRSANGQRKAGENQDGASESSEPLASDGSQDGDAFDKIEQHREQQDSQNSEGASGSSQDNSRSANGQRDAEGSSENNSSSGASNSAEQNSENNSTSNSGNQQGEKPSGQQSGNQSGSADSGGEKQPNKQPGQQQSGGSQGGSQQGEKPQADESGGEQQGGSQSQDQDQKNGGEQGAQEGNQSGGQQQGKKPEQGSQGGEKNNQGGQNDQGQNKNASGGQQGGQPQGGAKPEGDKPSSSGGGQQPKESSGGQGQNDKSGAGKESQEGGGSPQSQAEKPQQKNGGEQSGGQQGGGQKKEEGGKSPSGSGKSSQSQGESGGDRSGGGEQGGGQGAKKPGNDSAGSSSAGEQGDGAANEPGSGESGNRGGGDQVSDSPTGRSGEQTGEGSSSGQAEQGGEKPQPKSGNEQGGESSSSGKRPGGSRPKEGEQGEGQGEQISDTPGEGRGTLPTGGGKPADNHPSDTPLPDIEPGADAANLDYARKSTDLTLEYLKNQKANPDPKLLDDLGWTKDDLAQFIDRWDRMQRDAARDDTGGAKRKLDDSLRSLGLRPRTSEVRTDDAGGTRLTGQRDTGSRTRPPKEYAEQYRAFSKFITPAKE